MEERFETFDDAGRRTGLVPRSEVHRLGLWHRSAHVFVFNSRGDLLVQKRAPDKDLYADLWDYSVGEHLKPGESFDEGAIRGMSEELGVTGVTIEPIGVMRKSRLVDPDLGVADCEMQQAYRAVFDGDVTPDPVEVAEVKFVVLERLAANIQSSPQCFTPWFVRDLDELEILTC